jgi:ligand-binding SRPBCC domain-containing protein
MKVDIATTIKLPPEAVWDAVQRHELLRHIAWPLLRFVPRRGEQWPAHFTEGQAVAARLHLFGIIPMGEQWIVPSLYTPDGGGWPRRLRDNGHSRLIKRWDHWITVEPDSDGGTAYRDTVDVDARLLTPAIGLFAHLFYRHRQRRWRKLARTLGRRKLVWDEMALFAAAKSAGDTLAAWTALERVHIIAQPHMGMHIDSHITMLGYAIATRDMKEIMGQTLRLILAPLGNITGRLPIGNTGRANVSAFKPMPIPADINGALESQKIKG